MTTPHTQRTAATLSEATAVARTRGLRSLDSSIYSEPREGLRSDYIVRAVAIVGDGHWSSFGAGPTIEAAEARALVRVLSLALGVVVGPNGNGQAAGGAS